MCVTGLADSSRQASDLNTEDKLPWTHFNSYREEPSSAHNKTAKTSNNVSSCLCRVLLCYTLKIFFNTSWYVQYIIFDNSVPAHSILTSVCLSVCLPLSLSLPSPLSLPLSPSLSFALSSAPPPTSHIQSLNQSFNQPPKYIMTTRV